MRGSELALRKELALVRLRVARAELALARRRPSNTVASVCSAVDLVSSLLDGRSLGTWGTYARYVIHVVQAMLSLGRGV